MTINSIQTRSMAAANKGLAIAGGQWFFSLLRSCVAMPKQTLRVLQSVVAVNIGFTIVSVSYLV
ncbi:MAG: hypothetical protein HY960_09610 [Ignavibacteriae bacterium]|nr:hypothetical protein [Ignavibacteriota bacterium]